MNSMPKQSDDLTREGDEKQVTRKGLKIPVPSRDQISSALRKASRKSDEPPHPESSAPEKR